MVQKRILAFVLLSVTAMTGYAQPKFGGYVKFYHHNRFEGTNEVSRTGTRLQLTVQETLGSRAALFGSVDCDVDETRGRDEFFSERGASVDVYPVEMYVDLFWEKVDLRLGKQFIFWGKAEWVNPTDNINPWDYANMSAEIEDYRLPVTAARLDVYLGPATFQVVAVPLFVPHRIPRMSARTIQLPGGPKLIWKEPTLPSAGLKHGQLACRFLHSFAGIDWSVSYYRGNDHSPSYRLSYRLDSLTSAIEWTPYFPSIQVMGADFQKVFGSWGIRGEGAYFRTEDRDGRNVLVPNPHAQGVLTLDYTPTDRLALAIQALLEQRFKYHEDWERSQARSLGMDKPLPPRTSGASGRFRWKMADYWDSQMIFVWNRETRDRFVLAFVNYQPADALNLTLGGVFFGGKAGTPFGRMRDQDRIFFEVKASF